MLMVLATDLRQEELQVPSIYDLYGCICLTVKLESASPPGPRVLHFSLLHTCCPTESQSWIRSGPLCMWNFCGWRRRPRPGHNKLLTKHNLCYRMGACDITSSPGAVWDLGQTQALCVSRARAPCTRVLDHPAMSPLLSTGLDASWHSHTVR